MEYKIMALGLAGILAAGCDDRTVSTIGENVNLTRPEGCETVKDVRYNSSAYGYCRYQILCSNSKDEKLTLYDRFCNNESWRKIEVR